jgi:hypothetical protein
MAKKCSNYQERLPGLTDCGKTRVVEGYGLYRGKAGPPVYEKPSFCISVNGVDPPGGHT